MADSMEVKRQPVNVDRLIDEGKWAPFHTLTVGLCAAVVVLDGFDTQAIAYVAPVLTKMWNLSPAAFAPIFAAHVLGMMVGALAFGLIADRRGRRIAILASVAMMGVFSLATMYAVTAEQMMILRFLTGLGLGGAMPNVIALSSEYTPARWRSTAVGVMFCGFPFGAILGGILSAQIIPLYGWESVFLTGGVAPLLLLLVLIPLLPESVRFLVSRRGTEKIISRLLSKAVPDTNLPEQALFARTERAEGTRAAAQAELFGPGRISGTLMLWVAFFMNLLMYSFLLNWLPLTLQEAGIELSNAILFTVLLNVGGIAGTIILARVIDRNQSFGILRFVMLGAAVAIAMVGYVGPQGGLPLGAAIFVAGFCINGAQNNLNALAAGFYTTPARATGVGFALGIGRIGSILGPIIGGLLLAAKISLPALFIIGALPALVAAMAIWGLASKHQANNVAQSADLG